MATDHDHTVALCQEIANWLRAVALDGDEDLTPADRRELIQIALEVERRARLGETPSPE